MSSTILALLLAAANGWADQSSEARVDKSGYTLFNPTPRDLMRELSTDRPDKTESAYTVDAGHFQMEADLVTYSDDHYNDGSSRMHVETWAFATANLKVGLCNSSDLQLIVPTYNRVRVKDRTSGAVMENSGFGDLVTRLKLNLWGNDSGSTAFAVMPAMKWPTAQDDLANGAFEGSLIFPLSVELPRGWGLGAMTQFDIAQNFSGNGYHPEFINTITLGRDIVGDLAGYIEFFSNVSTESGSDWIGTFDMGLTYSLTDNIQLDAGVNIGLTAAADDFNPFAGLSIRF